MQLQFQGEKSPSIERKAAIVFWYILLAGAAAYLTFFAPGRGDSPGDPARQGILLVFVVIYIARAAWTLFAFVERKIPWLEALSGGGPIGIVLFFFLRSGLNASEPLGPVDGFAILLYLAGSFLGSASEHARRRWKSRPENKGSLYTEGLFRHCRHVNYFGDLLLFAGLAILTHMLWAGIVPLVMALNFALLLIPAHDAYLASRYGVEFERYARRTKKLVPFIY